MCKYGYLGGFCDGAHGANGHCKAAIVRLSVKFTDGSAQNISSTAGAAGGWLATTAANPIRFSHLFHGKDSEPLSNQCLLSCSSSELISIGWR